MLTMLTGGTGGAKLVQGLALEVDPRELTVICNTADDLVLYGLHISPDLDTVTYTLAGLSDPGKGWGIKGDSHAVLEMFARYGWETWFKLGDRDLATHITRSALLAQGASLSEATRRIGQALGVRASVLPMSDDGIETRIVTPKGDMSFQEFFVRDRWAADVERVYYAGGRRSRPAPGVLEAIQSASAIIVCPSNPVTSIGSILAVPGIRDALRDVRKRVLAVSPIIGGAAVSGPAGKLMASAGMEVSALGVARAYADFLDTLLIAPVDGSLRAQIEALGIRPIPTPILMHCEADKRHLAREVLALRDLIC